MHILSVELENIKRYSQASFSFTKGTNAISGPNGAGKSTIVEAIGFTLFDTLPYKKEDFLKRGEKQGTVRVTFESGLDGREYTVVRNTKTQYYVYDPEAKVRVAEQKVDVLAWLHSHLGLEPEAKLEEIFTTTIGVPQGTFTAIFLAPASQRKALFDRVLRVEEYRQASDALKDVQTHLSKALADIDTEVAGFRGQLLRLPDLEQQRDQLGTERKAVEGKLAGCRMELAHWQGRLSELDGLETRLRELRGEVERLNAAKEFTSKELVAAAGRVFEAMKAVQDVLALQPALMAYKEAEEALSRIREQRVERDAIASELAERRRRLDELRFTLEALVAELKGLEDDRRALSELAGPVAEQTRLEHAAEQARLGLSERMSLIAKVSAAETEIAQWSTRLVALEAEIGSLEALAQAPERVRTLKEQVLAEERLVQEAQARGLARREREQQLRMLTESLETERKALAALELDIEAKRPLVVVAERLAALEEQGQALKDQSAQMRAFLERDRESREAFRGGTTCPILSVGCPKLEGQDPNQYFDQRIADREAALKEVDDKLAELRKGWKEANEAARQVAHLPELEGRRRQSDEASAKRQADVERLQQELADLPESEPAPDRLAGLRRELEAAQAEAARYEQLPAQRAQQTQLLSDRARRQAEVDGDRRRLDALSEVETQLAAAERALVELGDPRSRAKALELRLAKEPTLVEERQLKETERVTVEAVLKDLETKLEPFNQLEADEQQALARREEAEPGYRKCLALEPTAASLTEREQEQAAIQERLDKLASESTEANRALAEAQERYLPDEHAGLRERVEGLKAETIKLEQAVGFLGDRLTATESEIASLRAIQAEMSEVLGKRERVESRIGFVEFSRATLKEAGPHITQTYLASISLEADRLYREITGNHQVHLRWSSDYEIMLEEQGRERPFVNLSGGEQMIAALAVRLALLKETSAINLAFFDEPTTNIDESRRHNLATQIGAIKDFDQLFVISHDDTFEQWTDHVVRVGEAEALRA